MRWCMKKTFMVICILQIVKCIQSQKPVLGLDSTETLSSDLLGENEEINSLNVDLISELATEASGDDFVTIFPTEANETTTEGQNQDNQEETTAKNCVDDCIPDSISQCVCDCNTGAVLRPMENSQCEEISDEKPTTTIKSIDAVTTTIANDINLTTKSTESQSRLCKMVGESMANKKNCHSYFICSPAAEELQLTEENCPLGTAYNAQLSRCARDLAVCKDDESPCLASGTFVDGINNSSYIWCVPSLSGQAMHKYRVRCASYEVFLPALGTCFIDVDKIKNGKPNFYKQHDIDMIKAELEEFKIMEKAKVKEEKLKLKFEKKLQKALIKKTIKDAKDRAKLEGKDSEEMESFVCMQEGYFKSPLGPNFYINCISKKGKLKEIIMLCNTGTNFNEVSGTCI